MFCRAVPPAACRLPKFADESFEPKIGKKFLILVAASSAVAPRSAEIKYYVPSFCTFFPLPGPNCSRQFGRTPAMYHIISSSSEGSRSSHLIISISSSPRAIPFAAQINIRNSKLKLAHTHAQLTHTHIDTQLTHTHPHTRATQAVCIVENNFAAEK